MVVELVEPHRLMVDADLRPQVGVHHQLVGHEQHPHGAQQAVIMGVLPVVAALVAQHVVC